MDEFAMKTMNLMIVRSADQYGLSVEDYKWRNADKLEQNFADHYNLDQNTITRYRERCNELVRQILSVKQDDNNGILPIMLRGILNKTLCWMVPDWNVVLQIEHAARQRRIVSWGCGYGWLESLLKRYGHLNVIGVDTFAEIRTAEDQTESEVEHQLHYVDVESIKIDGGQHDLIDPNYINTPKIWLSDIKIPDDDLQFQPNDVLLISWGRGVDSAVDQYIDGGGDLVIIIGEHEGGCTFPCDYLQNRPGWTHQTYGIPHYTYVRDEMVISRKGAII
jgi:hypothetical protein